MAKGKPTGDSKHPGNSNKSEGASVDPIAEPDDLFLQFADPGSSKRLKLKSSLELIVPEGLEIAEELRNAETQAGPQSSERNPDAPEGMMAAEVNAEINEIQADLSAIESTENSANSTDNKSTSDDGGDSGSPPKKPQREGLAKTFGLVAILNLLSKALGLVRDIVVLQVFGTSLITDAYFYAYQFTGNILVLFGGVGGPFHSAGVAILSSQPESQDKRKLVGQLMTLTY
jgi:hypothetical protein